MVQVETSQLAAECNTWRETLRKYRDEFTQDNIKLQHAAKPSLSKAQLQEVEHLHNQFHIQLINIHDLKHSIKVHHRLVEFELREQKGQLREKRWPIMKICLISSRTWKLRSRICEVNLTGLLIRPDIVY
jgi:hypothetical protein